MVCGSLIEVCSETLLLEWQIKHYENRLKEARRKTDNWQERSFLRQTLHGLKIALQTKLN